jgi:ankyrin repeat protein
VSTRESTLAYARFPEATHLSALQSHLVHPGRYIQSQLCLVWTLDPAPSSTPFPHDAWLTVDNRRRADLIQGLVTRGADINLANRQGLTPLHCAAQRVGSPSRSLLLLRSVLALCCLSLWEPEFLVRFYFSKPIVIPLNLSVCACVIFPVEYGCLMLAVSVVLSCIFSSCLMSPSSHPLVPI